MRVSPYLLLVLTTLFWAGNFVLARFMRLDVPPAALSFWRWALAALILAPFVWRVMVKHWPLVRANLGLVTLLSLLGVSGFNTLVYIGLQTTPASNATLLLSVTPVAILIFSSLILKVHMNLRQLLGILVSTAGVIMLVTRGEFDRLLSVGISVGDLWILAAVLSWAIYSVLLRKLPNALKGTTLLGYTVAIGAVGIFPFHLWEFSGGRAFDINPASLMTIGYVAIFPSILAFLFWNRAVDELGPNRAGQFTHLIPVFGTLLAVIFLGEKLYLYHAMSIPLVATGIYLTIMSKASK